MTPIHRVGKSRSSQRKRSTPDSSIAEGIAAFHLSRFYSPVQAGQEVGPWFSERIDHVRDSFEKLCDKKKCDPAILKWLLFCCMQKQHRQTLKQISGLDSRQWRKTAKRFHQVAKEIRAWNRFLHFGLVGPELSVYRQLPDQVDKYAETILDFAHVFSIRRDYPDFSDTVLRALVVDYVKSRTGKFFDEELSALLYALTGEETYDKPAHIAWRNRNYQRFEGIYDRVDKWCREYVTFRSEPYSPPAKQRLSKDTRE